METHLTSTIATFYVDSRDQALIICPHCGLERQLNVGAARGNKNSFSFRCPCGETFLGVFQFEEKFFKRVKLYGVYFQPETGDEDEMVVDIVSMDGLGFRTMGRSGLQPGDLVEVSFNLDNKLETEIRRTVKITDVNNDAVKGQYQWKKPYDPDLGYYIMP